MILVKLWTTWPSQHLYHASGKEWRVDGRRMVCEDEDGMGWDGMGWDGRGWGLRWEGDGD